MKNQPSSSRSGSMAFLFSMLLFLVFILCSVFIILIGSRVYTNIRARNDAAFYSDTALSYISNKVRQADRSGFVNVEEIDGLSVLVLTSEYDGILYDTWIYTKDGSLRELFSEKGSGLTTDDGLPIMDCGAVFFSLDEKKSRPLLTITLEEYGGDMGAAGPQDTAVLQDTLAPQNAVALSDAAGQSHQQAVLSLRSSRKGGTE